MSELAEIEALLAAQIPLIRERLRRECPHADSPDLVVDPNGRYILLDAVVTLANVRLAMRADN